MELTVLEKKAQVERHLKQVQAGLRPERPEAAALKNQINGIQQQCQSPNSK